MIIPEFKEGLEEGSLYCSFRLNRNQQIEIAIFGPEKWEIGVYGETIQQALERFQKAILMAVDECSMPKSACDDRDSALRVLNNVAKAKNYLLAGSTAEAICKLDDALSWAIPLLGMEHPMSVVTDHVLQPPLLGRQDTNQ